MPVDDNLPLFVFEGSKSVGIDIVCIVSDTCVSFSFGVDGGNAHCPHQTADFVVADAVPLFFEVPVDHTVSQGGAFGIDLIDLAHQAQIVFTDPSGPIIEATAVKPQKLALSHQGKAFELGVDETSFT